MADTSQVKKDIRDIVKRLGQEFNKEFYEGSIIENKECRKIQGLSSDNEICILLNQSTVTVLKRYDKINNRIENLMYLRY
ncbi:hypothetical protein NE172_03675 [Clostridium botulinum]|uniref:Uncharacterized protein n=1 Tax=Clostridium botulinum TaxID=1491 RepID=A0A6B4JKL9_CLOBO|nr:hypothetical protein [Clostridium botulinum]EES50688.1 hypothetical protein CLO_1102 [Clostridium botulinum E1 str. 'BoNT E Beluga']MBY6760256.1 hypothetical protein [Clostridium botulinum]MBY6919163.1 hypothetical protein [Clostridium botulinum]MCR1130039.1 hypothetical protein [Clostridium botulinum]NFJ57195.1 hypothetical protein [Clostridium botulinum]